MNVNVNTNIKNITTPPHQQVYANKQHIDKQRINNQHGFTIIEVALVLAIAGLIFLVVFLALPALQNSQKDTARKQDVGRVVSALQSYMADNGNEFPAGGAFSCLNSSGFSSYVGNLSTMNANSICFEPGVNNYQVGPNMDIYIDRTCAPTGSTAMPVSTGDAAVVVKLSSGNYYCASV